jgi:hypothetical protein
MVHRLWWGGFDRLPIFFLSAWRKCRLREAVEQRNSVHDRTPQRDQIPKNCATTCAVGGIAAVQKGEPALNSDLSEPVM